QHRVAIARGDRRARQQALWQVEAASNAGHTVQAGQDHVACVGDRQRIGHRVARPDDVWQGDEAGSQRGLFRRLFVNVFDNNGEGLLDKKPFYVGAAHADGIQGLRLEVEGGSRPQFIAVDGEGIVVVAACARHKRVIMRIAVVRIGSSERADGRTGRLVLGHCIGRQDESGRRFIHVGDGDNKDLLDKEPIFVGTAHADTVCVLRLKVEYSAGPQLIAGDGEGGVVGRARAVYQRVTVTIARVRVNSTERAHSCSGWLVLIDCAGRQSNVGWPFIYVGNGDSESLLDKESIFVGTAHADGVGGLRLKVEDGGRYQRV